MNKNITLRRLALTSALASAFLLGGCGEEKTETAPSTETTSAMPADTAAEAAVATVNGEPVDRITYNMAMRRAGQMGHANEAEVIDELVTLEVLRQEAVRQGLHEEPALQATLRTQESNILANALLRQHVAAQAFGEEELRAEYDKQVAQHEPEQEYHARHILVKTEEEARQLIEQLDQGADFAELAKEHSTGPTGPGGGDLGWFSANQMVRPFAEATAAMTPGTYSKEPVQTQFGWHVIKLEDSREMAPPSFEAAKPEIEEQLINRAVEDYINELRGQADISIEAAGDKERDQQE